MESGSQTYWHNVLWYFFYNDEKFKTYKKFRQELGRKDGARVDHMGGTSEIIDVCRLDLTPAAGSSDQGGGRRRKYR